MKDFLEGLNLIGPYVAALIAWLCPSPSWKKKFNAQARKDVAEKSIDARNRRTESLHDMAAESAMKMHEIVLRKRVEAFENAWQLDLLLQTKLEVLRVFYRIGSIEELLTRSKTDVLLRQRAQGILSRYGKIDDIDDGAIAQKSRSDAIYLPSALVQILSLRVLMITELVECLKALVSGTGALDIDRRASVEILMKEFPERRKEIADNGYSLYYELFLSLHHKVWNLIREGLDIGADACVDAVQFSLMAAKECDKLLLL